MTTPRVKPETAPQQPNGIPPEWELISEWGTPERDKMELYAGATRGRLLAVNGPYGPEIAAEITSVKARVPAVKWHGTYVQRSMYWRNAQAAIVRARLTGESAL